MLIMDKCIKINNICYMIQYNPLISNKSTTISKFSQ